MGSLDNVLFNLPEVTGPQQRRLSFKEKLKWTGITLLLFFALGMIPMFGLGENALQQFEFLSLILGAEFGSIISLGIGPLVTASIVMQLLNGSGIIKFDLTTHDGKKRFQGWQKMSSIFFIVFESAIYVFMGGLAPSLALKGTPVYLQIELFLVVQLFLGGILIMFMDEVVSKWGFGSGISLFIAAGVSKSVFVRLLSPLDSVGALGWPFGEGAPSGKLIELFYALSHAQPATAGLAIAAILATILVFVLAVYAQSMKVEIPLSFGRIRGHGIRWPLSFIYTSNIPVILVSALIANIQLWARLLQNWGYPLLGTFSGNSPQSGLVFWLYSPNIVENILTGSMSWVDIGQASVYILFMIAGAVLFSVFWVQTAGMDAKSQARNMINSGLHMPGFRQDQRVLETLLNRYIWPLTVMGAIAVGILAAVADLSGALSQGTGILLTVMIVYKLYEEIAKHHMSDMYPMMRKMME
jgi:preprotein translocase subunit SecY